VVRGVEEGKVGKWSIKRACALPLSSLTIRIGQHPWLLGGFLVVRGVEEGKVGKWSIKRACALPLNSLTIRIGQHPWLLVGGSQCCIYWISTVTVAGSCWRLGVRSESGATVPRGPGCWHYLLSSLVATLWIGADQEQLYNAQMCKCENMYFTNRDTYNNKWRCNKPSNTRAKTGTLLKYSHLYKPNNEFDDTVWFGDMMQLFFDNFTAWICSAKAPHSNQPLQCHHRCSLPAAIEINL